MSVVSADKTSDLVDGLPGFEDVSWDFQVYSGFVEVPGPLSGYDSLMIHYQFHTSQRNPNKDPVVAWHNGGPGAESISLGLYGEMGAFIIGENANYLNPFAWNRVANMLYLDSPAGVGASQCIKAGAPVACRWDDVSQGEAYAHTLAAFFKDFPEFAKNELYLTGESYFGQYGPNIVNYIVNNDALKSSIRLRGIALGNACWGEHQDGELDGCNGPNEVRNNVEFFFGKGLFSPKLHARLYDACDFPDTSGSECKELLAEMRRQVGPHNTQNVYDNCPQTKTLFGKAETSGGYVWDCLGDAEQWLARPDVRKALHLDRLPASGSSFDYNMRGPSAVSLYPEIAKFVRILIYNGDADANVPYVGNEEWIDGLEAKGVLSETSAWSPWYTTGSLTPAGSVTEYSVANSSNPLWFATLRLAGHEVPTFQPRASLDMISRWLDGTHIGGDARSTDSVAIL